jgi:hypothetical protein
MTNADKPAYPVSGSYSDENPAVIVPVEYGLTKRELIAAQAMQGILSNYWCQNDWKDKLSALDFSIVATQSVGYADALLKELDKPKT